MASKYGCSVKTIQRRLDKVEVKFTAKQPDQVVVIMDTTYFGREFGVMLYKDARTGANLLKQYVKHETNKLYKDGIKQLLEIGFEIKAIVCDGRRGLLSLFPGIPIQLCVFHQVAIITRYLTRNPKSQAGKELRELTFLLKQTDKESFIGLLDRWHERWEGYLNERTVDPITKRSFYTHRRLRSAYRSLMTNLPWLFTSYDYPELMIPSTTNMIDGHFADMKNKLRNHNGLSIKRKMKLIDEFFKA